MKYASKWKRYLISMFLEVFSSYEHVLTWLLENWRKRFPPLVFMNMFLLPLWNHRKQGSFGETPIAFRQNPLNFLGMNFTSIQDKRKMEKLFVKQKEAIPQKLSTPGHQISEWHQKDTFDISEIVNNQGAVCQTVRFILSMSYLV